MFLSALKMIEIINTPPNNRTKSGEVEISTELEITTYS